MKVFILMVIMNTNGASISGGMIAFQEFNTLEQCNYAAKLIRRDSNTAMTQCVEK